MSTGSVSSLISSSMPANSPMLGSSEPNFVAPGETAPTSSDTPPTSETAGRTSSLPPIGSTLTTPPAGRLDKNELLMDVSALLIMLIQFYRALRITYRDAETAQLDVEVAAMESIAEKMMTAADEMLDARLSEAIAGIVMGVAEAGMGAYSVVTSMRASPESKLLKADSKALAQAEAALPRPLQANQQADLDAQRAALNARRETLVTEEHTKQLRRQVVMQGVGGLVQAGKSTGSLVAGLYEYDARMADAAQKLIETVQKTAAFGRERTHDMSAESTEMLNHLLRTLDQLWKDEQGMQQVLLQKFA